jgi:hypothetical protein
MNRLAALLAVMGIGVILSFCFVLVVFTIGVWVAEVIVGHDLLTFTQCVLASIGITILKILL